MRKITGCLAQAAFGKLGSAGGHASSARAEVPLMNLDKEMPPWSGQWQVWQDFIIQRVEKRGRLGATEENK